MFLGFDVATLRAFVYNTATARQFSFRGVFFRAGDDGGNLENKVFLMVS